MSKIRDDIFPRMAEFFQPKEKTLSEYVDETFEALADIFKTKAELIEYINSLKSPEIAELFFHISHFYLVAKKYQTSSYVKLIMIISAVENLISQNKEFEEFFIWIQKQNVTIEKEICRIKNIDTFKEVIQIFADEYYKIYGSRRNVLDFFVNHLSKENKLKLVRSFKGAWTDYIEGFLVRTFGDFFKPFPTNIFEAGERLGRKPSKHLMLYCFDWRECYTQYGECHPSIHCKIEHDEELLNAFLKKVVADLYQMRNDFIHSARVTPLNEKDSIGMLGVLGPKRKHVSIELTDKDLQSIFENGFKNYFDKLRIN